MAHIHSDSEYDFTVTGNIVHKGKILLIKHKFLPFWLVPGGHIELNETPIEALYKEVKEESGITKDHLKIVETSKSPSSEADGSIVLPFDINVHTIGDDGHRHINLSYVLVSDTDIVSPEEGESQQWRWFSKNELEDFDEMPHNAKDCALFAIEKAEESV